MAHLLSSQKMVFRKLSWHVKGYDLPFYPLECFYMDIPLLQAAPFPLHDMVPYPSWWIAKLL